MWSEIMDFAARPSHGITDAFKPSATVAASISVLGAVVADPIIAWSAALAAVGTTLVPRLIDWYRQGREVKRAADLADLKAHAEAIEEEIRRRVELEGECRQLKAEISQNRHRVNDLEQQIIFMKAATQKLDSKVQILTTPDPDAPEPGTDEHSIIPPKGSP